MLNIICGLDLDGYEPLTKDNFAGTVSLGPLGLLGVLETRLGLSGVFETQPMRVSQYLRCLRSADDGVRFYSRSLLQDELSVAKTLLAWRDQWIEAGWDGMAAATDSRRIQDLAHVEVFARTELSPGFADRVCDVLKQLQSGTSLKLSIALVDPLEDFSQSWQQIFNIFQAQFKRPVCDEAPQADPETDLGKLQRAVKEGTPQTLNGDGSVILVKASSLPLLAQATARLSFDLFDPAETDDFPTDLQTLLVGSNDLHLVDQACQEIDRARFNVSAASRWRPPLQVLPLVLSLLWEPLDPNKLLEFLTHPVCPLPSRVRFPLAEVVSQYPGVKGEAWQKVCTELDQALKAEAKAAGKPAPDLDQMLKRWIPEQRFAPNPGAPLAVLTDIASRVAQWTSARSEHPSVDLPQKTLFRSSTAQASQAQRILEEMASGGANTLSRLQLERLLDQVTAEGSSIARGGADLGAVPACCSPGMVVGPCERILWWNFVEPVMPKFEPFSPTEVVQLKSHGATLPEREMALSSQARRWQRPVLAARQQLVLTVPRGDGAEAVRQHPLWSMIAALCGGDIPEFLVEDALAGVRGLPLVLHNQPRQPLPAYRRWWSIGRADLLTARFKESYSSLDRFIKSPYQWVLNYKAKLHMGSLHNIEAGNRQKGNLMHRLCERLFKASDIGWRTASETELEHWVEAELARLLPEEGANLFLPGKGTEREGFVSTAKRSVASLVDHLRAASVVHVEMEAPAQGAFVGGDLGGYIDMLLTNDRGEKAVLDLKWSGAKYRKGDLEENTALQLAAYAYLKRQGRVWPEVGYFLLADARLLFQGAQFFPLAEIVDPGLGVNPSASLWKEFEAGWIWRRAQLDQGIIEVTVEGTLPDTQSVPPAGAMPVGEFNDTFNDYSVLTGWRDDA